MSTTSRFEERTTYGQCGAAANARTLALEQRWRVLACLVLLLAGCGGEAHVRQPIGNRPAAAKRAVGDTTVVVTGQWIWSRTDSATFVAARRAVPDLVPTVWIGTVTASRTGQIRTQLALSPRVAASLETAVVVRFEDSFTNAWATASDTAVATVLVASIRSLLAAARATTVRIIEVQLDYDCPERLLPRWARVVDDVARNAAPTTPLWITSLVAHVRQPSYGDLFRTAVHGHILQVFDTGDAMTPSYARALAALASRQALPFRLGVAAFERELASGRTTEHRAWFAASGIMAESGWYRGLWVFPGGQSWTELFVR